MTLFHWVLMTVFWGVQGDLPDGLEIARHVNARDEGRSVSRNLLIELIDRNGKRRTRETRGFRKIYPNGEKRSVLFYVSPANIKGTALLSYDYPGPDRDDDQWLYLPALQRVRRIPASRRGDSFLGTDFTYEDIKQETKVSIEDHVWTTVGEEEINGRRCYVVESIPVSEKAASELGYGRARRSVDAEIWLVLKGQFWDAQGNLIKTQTADDVRRVQGIWTVHRLVAQNHKTGHRTEFTFSEVDYETEIDDDAFTQRSLRRGP